MIHQNAIVHFWEQVNKGRPSECWEWTGNYQVTDKDYKLAKYTASRNVYVVAVFAYTVTYGPVPEGKQVNHKCDNSLCCNPSHLYAGTQSQNVKDAWDRTRPKLQVGDSVGFIHKKLSDEDKDSIRASKEKVSVLAARHGVHRNHIYRIRK